MIRAALLFALAWLLFPHYDPQQPLVSLGLLVTLCGGWGLLITGIARALGVSTSTFQPCHREAAARGLPRTPTPPRRTT